MIDAMRRRVLAMLTGAVALLPACGAHAGAGEPTTGARLFERVRPLLAVLHDAVLAAFLADWPPAGSSDPGSMRTLPVPAAVPVLRWLPQISAAAPPWSAAWVAALATAAPVLAWRRSYSAAAVGERFYENYGWTEFAGLTGPVPSPHLACGVLLLGPHVTYPPHRHEAEELYVPLAGVALWRRGTEAWRERSPGEVIHHARHLPHAMQTLAEPLLALYLWRSDNLAQSSQLDAG